MKIIQADYKRLEPILQKTLEKFPLDHTQADYKKRGLSETRLLFDYLHASVDRERLENVENYLFLRSLYDYLTDDNIETALRRIILK
jgi:hypothetical protein